MKKFPKHRKKIIIRVAKKRWLKKLKKKKNKVLYSFYKIDFLEFLYKYLRHKSKPRISSGTARIEIPKVFSIYHEPDRVLETISSIVSLKDDKRVKYVHFNHKHCKTIDLSPSAIMDLCVMDLKKLWRGRKKKGRFEGEYPDDVILKDMLRETGVVKHLNIKGHELPSWKKKDYNCYKLTKGGKYIVKPRESSDQEKVAHDITEYFNDCLNHANYSLTEKGKGFILSVVAEILDNVEQHTKKKEWYIIGYMRKDDQIGECNIAIFNLGNTIFESYTVFESDPDLLEKLRKKTKRHQSLFRDTWTEESLWTLYSMQEGVSRFLSEDERTRGQGTIQMIEFFLDIGKTIDTTKKPRMAILSGSTLIKFDGKYRLKPVTLEEGRRKVIAFNKANNLNKRPNPKAVRTIKNFFPGTIIDLKFYIDRSYLSKIVNEVKS